MRVLPCLLAAFLALSVLDPQAGAQARMQRPTLGVSLHLEGLPVESVDEGSMAAVAGLRAGDFLTHWNSRPLADIEAVIDARDAERAGAEVTLRVLRKGGSTELKLRMPDPKPAGGIVLGVNVGTGLFVAAVVPDSSAARAGVEAGDILESLGGRQVHDLPTLRALLDQVRWGESRELGLRRGGNALTLSAVFKAPEGMASPFTVDEPEGRSAPLPVDRLPRWGSTLLSLDDVKKEIDLAVTELEGLGDQRLAGVIERLRGQSRRLSAIAEPLGKMKLWSGNLREDIDLLRDLPFGPDFDLHELQKRMDALMERHGDDLDALRRALGEEFPGMDIFIEKGEGGPLELKIEREHGPEEAVTPAVPLQKRHAPKAEPAPTPEPAPTKEADAAKPAPTTPTRKD